MANIITQLARYLIILLMALFCWYHFTWFVITDKGDRNYACRGQNICMFLILVLADTVAWLRTQDAWVLALLLLQTAFLAAYMLISRLLYPKLSRLLLNDVCMLLATGFIMLTRISPTRSVRQFLLIVFSAGISLAIPVIIDRVWQLVRIPWVYGIGGLLLLLFVRLIGTASFGAQLSLRIAGFTFQPSEFVKLTYVFFIAAMFHRSTELQQVIRVSLLAAAHVLVLVFSRDLGSALIFFVSYICMLYIATGRLRWLLAGTAGGTLAAWMAYHMFAHVRKRVIAWKDPFADIANTGYQMSQALFAIGTGGWFGMGLYQGMPHKIPVVEKDFIFAAISEELGGFYGIGVILICLGCVLQFLLLSMRMDAVFYRQLALGLGVIYGVQVFLTIGGVTKFIPSTGVTLPFVSYGGSSVLSSFIMFGVLQGLYMLKEADEADEAGSAAGSPAGEDDDFEEMEESL